MAWIKLTNIEDIDDPNEIWVNTLHLVHLERGVDDKGSYVNIKLEGLACIVKETVEEILDMIKAAES